MPAFVNLPWLNSSDQFLQAVQAGARAGLEKAQLQQRAAELSQRQQPRMGPVVFGGGASPLEAAKASAITAEQAQNADMAQRARSAWDLHNDLLRRGATAQEAYEQAGLGEFGIKPNEAGLNLNQDKIFEVGNQVVGINPLTGANRVLYQAPAKPLTEPRYTIPTSFDILGKPAGTTRLTLPELRQMAPDLPDQVRTNFPVAGLLKLGGTNSAFVPTPQKRNEVIRFTKDGRQAVFNADTKEFIRYGQ